MCHNYNNHIDSYRMYTQLEKAKLAYQFDTYILWPLQPNDKLTFTCIKLGVNTLQKKIHFTYMLIKRWNIKHPHTTFIHWIKSKCKTIKKSKNGFEKKLIAFQGFRMARQDKADGTVMVCLWVPPQLPPKPPPQEPRGRRWRWWDADWTTCNV